jgi:hypothetical protein
MDELLGRLAILYPVKVRALCVGCRQNKQQAPMDVSSRYPSNSQVRFMLLERCDWATATTPEFLDEKPTG